MADIGETSQRQQEHFDAMALEYERHYSGEWGNRYRDRFINAPLLDGLELRGARVLEAMCGSGQTTAFLLGRGALVTGLDISPQLVASFAARWPTAQAVCASIFENSLEDASFDAVIAIGGLHHLHPGVEQAINEFHRVLKPGGYFCFVEPHAGSLPDRVRSIWYRYDNLFEENEGPLNIRLLQSKYRSRFRFIKTTYGGNIAYLLVLNTMVLHIPETWRRFYAPPLMWAEGVLSRWFGRRLSCFAMCQWQKID